MDTILYFIHYALLLQFGLLLSAAFAGVRFSKKNLAVYSGLFVLCGLTQIAVYTLFDEAVVWKAYPLITHLPAVLLLCLHYRKRLATALAATASPYLCCQPAKWFGLMVQSVTGSYAAEQIVRILTLLAVGFVAIRYLSSSISAIYSKDNRSVWIFGMIPVVYYLFDYSMGIYTNLWVKNDRTAAEFLPFFLCIIYLFFCVIYYKEYEQKADAERKEHMIRLTVEQQSKEIKALKRGEYEVRLLRHDMRLFLNGLSLCVEEGDKETARKMIAGFSAQVEATALRRYCRSDTVNYVLSDFSARCQELDVPFAPVVELTNEIPDEIIFCTIVSNALDNALNAQKELPENKRSIKLMLKSSNGKILLSVKNPFLRRPVFSDGMPVSTKHGHGYGTQSIRYMTERLGGNCLFTIEDDRFILRVVI